MTSPYQLLGVSEQASETEIKSAYLEQVKNCPPERDPVRFKHIHQAYQSIKDPDSRLRHALFDWPEADFDALVDQAFGSGKPARSPLEVLLALARNTDADLILRDALTRKS